MKIELRKLSDIKPYPGNPRQNDAAVDAVAESIRQFGFRQPIVVDTEGVIICGHTRYKAALKLGLEKVPVHVAKDLTPAQIKAYRIADNQTANLAAWDYELLPIELSDLQGMDFDLGLLGFSKDELAKLLDHGVQEGLTDPDDDPRAAGRGDHQAGRSVDPGRPPAALRRQQQARGRGSAAGWGQDPARQHRSALQRGRRAADQ